MGCVFFAVIGAWVVFYPPGGSEAYFDDVTGSVVTVDGSPGEPIRLVGTYASAADASAAISAGGVGALPSVRQIGYTAPLIAVVNSAHHSRIGVEMGQGTAAWVSVGVVVGLLVHGLVFGYWLANQRTGRM